MSDKIHDRARGKWVDILIGIGIDRKFLSGRHTACPLCGGKDRFRLDDREGRGTFICSHCGAGSGVDLAMKWLKCDFITAKKEIERHIGSAVVRIRKATNSNEAIRQWLSKTWMDASRLSGDDAASQYLLQRGINIHDYPTQIRFSHNLAYRHDDGTKTFHPAMIARFVSPDTKDWTLHFTYLSCDGTKAPVEKVKKLAPMQVPPGGAVRLASSSETMGIAEGIETALSAQLLFGMPVWAALSTVNLMKWRPPPTAKTIVVFADRDESYAGQMSAYSLAYKLRGEGFGVDVRMPDTAGEDWNDFLIGERKIVAAE